MKKLYTTILLLLFAGTLTLHAQTIKWFYDSPGAGAGGQEQAFTVTQAIDGGYVFAGRTGPVGANAGDFYISKIDSVGHFVWSKTYVGYSMDEARGIIQLKDGTFAVAGVTVNFGGDTSTANLQQMIFMKLDANGDTIWTKRYGGPGTDTGDGIDTTSDGGYVLCGRYGVLSSNNNFYIVKTDANGDTLWTKNYGGVASDVARSIKQTHDGGYIVAGTTKSFGANAVNGNIWLMKLNSSGDTVWTKAIGSINEEECYSVKQTADNGYILAGRTGDNSANSADIYIVKTDTLGNVQWSKTYGSPYNDLGRNIILTSDGGYALAGWVTATQGPYSSIAPLMYVIKMDAQGNKQWDLTTGNSDSPNGANGYSIQETRDGNFIVAGQTDLGNGFADIRAHIIKISSGITSAAAEKNSASEINLYPNPATDNSFITINSTGNDKIKIDLIDITGKVVSQETTTVNAGINFYNYQFPNQPAGIYMLKIGGTKINATAKLVIIK